MSSENTTPSPAEDATHPAPPTAPTQGPVPSDAAAAPPGGPASHAPGYPPAAPQQGPGYPGSPPPGYPAPGSPPAPAPVSYSDAKTMSLLAHLGGILVGFVAPLVIYLIYKDRSDFVRAHATEALNFQITLAIAYLASVLLMVVYVGVFLMLATWVCGVVFAILATMAANNGQPYRYPISLRLVS